MDARLVEVDDPAWRAALETVTHDVYHLPSYAAFAARHQHPGRPVAFLAADGADRLVMPLIVRPLPVWLDPAATVSDAISPRGYAGPVAGPGGANGDAFIARAIDTLGPTLRAALRKKGKLALTVTVTFKPKSGGTTKTKLKVKLKRRK